MAVAVTGSTAPVAATTITLPAHNVGDCIIVYAWRNNTVAGPTVPTAGGTVPTWTDIKTSPISGNNSGVYVLCWAIATATNHTSGTWTNASGMVAVVLSGTDQIQPIVGRMDWTITSGTSYNFYVPYSIAETLTTGDINGTPQWPQRDISGNSVLLNFLSGPSITTFGAAPSGWTRLTGNGTGKICINQKNSSSGVPSSTVITQTGNTNSYYDNVTIEVVVPQVIRSKGQLTTAATSGVIPPHAAGDLILAYATNTGATTIPTQPSAGGTVPTWNTYYSNGAQRGLRISYAVATAGNHTSGTWTNASALTFIVLSRNGGWTNLPVLAASIVGSSQSASTTHTGPAITTIDKSGLGFTLSTCHLGTSVAPTSTNVAYAFWNYIGAGYKFDATDGSATVWSALTSIQWMSAQLELQGLIKQPFFTGF